MYRFTTIDLGTYRGENYVLVGFVDPPPESDGFDPDDDADDYGVSLARTGTLPNESNHEIVRLDTKHGRPHLDRVNLPASAGKPTKVWLDDSWNYSKMESFLLTHWRTFVDEERRYGGPQ